MVRRNATVQIAVSNCVGDVPPHHALEKPPFCVCPAMVHRIRHRFLDVVDFRRGINLAIGIHDWYVDWILAEKTEHLRIPAIRHVIADEVFRHLLLHRLCTISVVWHSENLMLKTVTWTSEKM